MSITVLRGGHTQHHWSDTIRQVKTTGDCEAVKISFSMGSSGGITDVMVLIDAGSFEAICIEMLRSDTSVALHTFARMITAALTPDDRKEEAA